MRHWFRRPPSYAEQLRAITPTAWCIDTVDIDRDGWVTITGWAVSDEADGRRKRVHINGMDAQAETGLHRPDVAHYYWFLTGADRSGFACRHKLPDTAGDRVRLDYSHADATEPRDSWQSIYINRREFLDRWPLPDMDQIHRVHGGNGQSQFQVHGFTTFVTLERVFAELAGRPMGELQTLLDFGCGCGRIARYFPAGDSQRVIGADIDRDNIEWCRGHLRGEFVVNDVMPPLSLATASIDAVVAIDVFTHLREADGLRWIAELARVCRPGGVAAVSIASRPALLGARFSEAEYADAARLDFLDLSANPDLRGVLGDPDYYRNVFHSHGYVREQWSRCGFDVLAIVPAAIEHLYDLVVMRRR